MISRFKRAKQRAQAGFTLIELLVVITILGILAAIVVFSVSGVTDRGQKSACVTDTTTIRTGLEAYYAKNNTYPASSTGATSLVPNFLSTPSSLHNLATATGGTSYTITEALGTGAGQFGAAQCGVAVGNAVDGTTNF